MMNLNRSQSKLIKNHMLSKSQQDGLKSKLENRLIQQTTEGSDSGRRTSQEPDYLLPFDGQNSQTFNKYLDKKFMDDPSRRFINSKQYQRSQSQKKQLANMKIDDLESSYNKSGVKWINLSQKIDRMVGTKVKAARLLQKQATCDNLSSQTRQLRTPQHLHNNYLRHVNELNDQYYSQKLRTLTQKIKSSTHNTMTQHSDRRDVCLTEAACRLHPISVENPLLQCCLKKVDKSLSIDDKNKFQNVCLDIIEHFDHIKNIRNSDNNFQQLQKSYGIDQLSYQPSNQFESQNENLQDLYTEYQNKQKLDRIQAGL